MKEVALQAYQIIRAYEALKCCGLCTYYADLTPAQRDAAKVLILSGMAIRESGILAIRAKRLQSVINAITERQARTLSNEAACSVLSSILNGANTTGQIAIATSMNENAVYQTVTRLIHSDLVQAERISQTNLYTATDIFSRISFLKYEFRRVDDHYHNLNAK